jgi:hypothetical protein
VSRPSSSDTRSTPSASNSAVKLSTWTSDRPRRSSFATTTASRRTCATGGDRGARARPRRRDRRARPGAQARAALDASPKARGVSQPAW